MSSLFLQVLAVALGLSGAGLLLWQRAKWQERRKATTMGIDQLLALDLGMPVEQFAGRQKKQRQQAALGDAKRWPLKQILLRAGLSSEPRTLVFACLPALVLGTGGAFFGGLLLSAILMLVGVLLVVMWVHLRIGRLRRALTHEIPVYLDNVVRLMTVGHSVQSAFQNAPVAQGTPLARAVEHASRLQAGGLDPDQALLAVGELYDATELVLLASILRMSMRFGGRADLIIARVAVFIRDREQAQQELMAQSSETRLSAWVLGLLPISLACYIVAANPEYIGRMWADGTGRQLLIGALVLQLLGGAFLYKLTKSLED